MGIFSVANDPITEEVERVTDEKNTEDDWGKIMSICDKAGKNTEDAKNYLRAISKRLYNSDPHIALHAITLLDACIKNSGHTFHIEVASRDFETDFTKLMTKGHPAVAKKLRECLKKWSENEFKSDPQLTLIPSLYSKLKLSGFDFSLSDLPTKKMAQVNKDPNVVDSNEEEEQIMKAIELSLKESTGSPRASASTSLYPSTNLSSVAVPSVAPAPVKEPVKVRALYDFEAAEENELTFTAGEMVIVLDNSDPNWWKGSNHRGEGLFPANFVTTDLSIEPENFLFEKAKKIVQFKESVEVSKLEKEPEDVEINEDKIDRLLHLLHEADPTNPERDTDEMLVLEKEVNGMGPLIDSELERVDRKHAQLTQLSADLVEALSLYHTLMREPLPHMSKLPYGYNAPSQSRYNDMQPPMSNPMMGHQMGCPMSTPMNMGIDRQGPYMHPGNMPQYVSMPPAPGANQMPSMHSMPGQRPLGMMPGQGSQNVPDERRMDPNMPPYGLPNFGLPMGASPVPHFQVGPPVGSQTHLPNGPPQSGHFNANTSSRMM